MSSEEFEPAISAINRPQTYALYRTAIGWAWRCCNPQ